MMKHLEDLTVKELRQAAKELNIKGRSKMNKAELIEALKTREPKKEKTEEKTNQEANQNTDHKVVRKIVQNKNTDSKGLIRIWHDVVRTLPPGTPVTVKMFSDEDVIKTFTGKLKEGNRKRDDGLPDVFIKIRAKKPFNIQLYDNIQVFMTEKDYQKARYGE
nr:MAG TPA: Rho termination factor, N-terminal domain [Caudoviricetes sp.]